MKTVLVTGGAGFIGHHVIAAILEKTDWSVVSLDRLDCSGNLNRLTDMSKFQEWKSRIKVIFHDLRAEVNSQLTAQVGPVNYILHLAASTHVDRSIEDPMQFVMDNVVGTTNILQFARHQKSLEAMIQFSTDEVFGAAPKGVNFKEWDRYCSGNPYAASKAGAEEMALAFANTYDVPVMVTHTMNVFGERQNPEKFIPMVVNKVLNGETVTIHSNKTKTESGTRFYLHARNAADALLFILQGRWAGKGEKYNIVGEKEISNLDMAWRIAKILGRNLKYEMVDFHSSRPGHDLRYALDGALLAAMGWKPPVDFEKSLEKTILWTAENPRWLLG